MKNWPSDCRVPGSVSSSDHGQPRATTFATICRVVQAPMAARGRRYCWAVTAGLSSGEIDSFVRDGFIRIEGAFPRLVADQGRALLWDEMGLSADEPAGWSRAVIRLPGSGAEPFDRAVNVERLHRSFDQLVGPGRWIKRSGLGTFPIRFPNLPEPDDTGWHCDGSFGSWPYRLNLRSRGRALLMLFLFSDVGPEDAPTRIRVGSHLDVPPMLVPAGEEGMSFLDLAQRLGATSTRPIEYATGSAGDVYLCHPFLVHAAQRHRGTEPRFIAQPPLEPALDLQVEHADRPYSPVERATRLGLGAE
ncbi:MAG: phytanoyl-CoA dioxygenase family protein [Acidimicrobiales bacterium]